MMIESKTYAVDPDRLASGSYSHTSNRYVGEGDISASYSADRIGQDQPVRKPFRFDGDLWICVGKCGAVANCYRLVHPTRFPDVPVTYAERVRNGDEGRRDPFGFYHGMRVKHGRQDFVLCGPEASFVEGEKVQMSLF